MAACRSTVRLASAFAHTLLPKGRRRVLLIQLNPSLLRVTKCLMHVRIVTALEYGCNPGDVGHRSPEASLAYGSKFCFKLAMHGSHALIDPPLAGYTSSVPGPLCLTIGVVFVAGVGYGLIFRYRIKFDDGQVAICGRTNLNYTGSSTLVLKEGLTRTSNGIKLLVCRVTSR
jgi:type IV secretory pathway VirB2 component (pilin)